MKKVLLPLSFILNILLVVYAIQLGRTPQKHDMSEPRNQSKIEVIDEKDLPVEPVNIVMLGNSITHGGDWQQLLNRKDVFNGGKPGWTTQQLSWVIKDFIKPNKPKLCFFKGGINDYTLGITTQRIYRNITAVLDTIKKAGTQPVYTTTLYQRTNEYRNRQIDSLNGMMKAFCESRGYDYVDLRPYLCENGDILDTYVLPDNTHLEPIAYPQWAKALQPVLKKYGL